MSGSIQTEKLKYGIGIVADYSSVELSSRVVKSESIESIDGATVCEMKNVELGIENNPLFQHIAQQVKDSLEIKIETEDRYALNVVGVHDTAMAYIKVLIPANAHVTIHEQFFPKDFLGCIVDVVVGENAQVIYIADQRASENTSVLALRRAFVGERARIKWIDIAAGAGIANSTIYTSLDGYGAVGETYGLFLGNENQLHDIAHTTIHNAPNTTSRLRTNGALDGSSKAIYRSLIDIREHATNSDGEQKEETLLLSKSAQVSSVPDLEIANNEVTCSHGVSTTNIDDRSLFYFHSRGVDTAEAKQAIVDGHLGVILDMIEDESIKLRIADALQKQYE